MEVATNQKEKFAAIVLEHFSALKRFALSLCRNDADADELVADTILAALQHFGSLKDEQKAKQWLFRILNNRFITHRRRQKFAAAISVKKDEDNTQNFSLFETLAESSFTDNGNPEKELINQLNRQQIDGAIAALPDEFRIAFTLCDVDGFSYQEIADMINVPVGTVRSRIARARSRLQQSLWVLAQEAGLKIIQKKKEKKDYVCTCGKEAPPPNPLPQGEWGLKTVKM